MKKFVVFLCLMQLTTALAFAKSSIHFIRTIAKLKKQARGMTNRNRTLPRESQQKIEKLEKYLRYPHNLKLKNSIIGFDAGDQKLYLSIKSILSGTSRRKIEQYIIPFDRVKFKVVKDLTIDKRRRRGHFIFQCLSEKPEIQKILFIDQVLRVSEKKSWMKSVKFTFGRLNYKEYILTKAGKRKAVTRLYSAKLDQWLHKLLKAAQKVQHLRQKPQTKR